MRAGRPRKGEHRSKKVHRIKSARMRFYESTPADDGSIQTNVWMDQYGRIFSSEKGEPTGLCGVARH